MSLIGIVLVAVGGVLLISIVWRWASWPCPYWLVPLLENPYFDSVAGAAMVLERAGVRPGMRVLDVGCGPGRVTLPASRAVGPSGSVLGLDIQRRMIQKLEARLRAEHIANVELLNAGLGQGRLPRDRFDVALLVTMLGEVRDKHAALEELRGSLRPGGVVSITEALPDPHYLTSARVRGLFTRAGFQERSICRSPLAYTLNFTWPGGPGSAGPD